MQASASLSGRPLVDAKTKIDGGNLLDARGILNTPPWPAGTSAPADAASARQMLGNISQTVFFSKEQFKDETYQTLYKVKGGDRLARIADHHAVTWELICRINGLPDPRKLRVGQTIKIPTGPFHCVITKSEFRLDVYLGSPGEAGSLFVTSFRVGLGKDNSTPTGTWMVASGSKAHPATYYSPRGEGVIAADDPQNPLGGYWLGLTGMSGEAVGKTSYGIHGTIEPDSIGKQASMGCIRLGADDISSCCTTCSWMERARWWFRSSVGPGSRAGLPWNMRLAGRSCPILHNFVHHFHVASPCEPDDSPQRSWRGGSRNP